MNANGRNPQPAQNSFVNAPSDGIQSQPVGIDQQHLHARNTAP